MDNGAVGSAFDHAAESWDNDVVECDMVKTIVRGHAACHVRGVVMPRKKALVIPDLNSEVVSVMATGLPNLVLSASPQTTSELRRFNLR